MPDQVETVTVTIQSEADDVDEVTIPAGLVELLAEDEQSPAETIGDVVLLSFASRAHHVVHHEGPEGEDFGPEEAEIMELFEERFGVTYAEATGHHH